MIPQKAMWGAAGEVPAPLRAQLLRSASLSFFILNAENNVILYVFGGEREKTKKKDRKRKKAREGKEAAHYPDINHVKTLTL